MQCIFIFGIGLVARHHDIREYHCIAQENKGHEKRCLFFCQNILAEVLLLRVSPVLLPELNQYIRGQLRKFTKVCFLNRRKSI